MKRRLPLQKRFKSIGGRPVIELNLKTPHQLFDERDPAPFRERDLDDDAALYILSSYRDLPAHSDAKLSLYFSSMGEFEPHPGMIGNAIRSHFEYESVSKRKELRVMFNQGFVSLLIGLTFLFVSTYVSYIVSSHAFTGYLPIFAHEGLLLMGWCAMWKPLNTFLYEWWPLRETIEVLDELSDIEIDLSVNPARRPVAAQEVETRPIHASTVLKTS